MAEPTVSKFDAEFSRKYRELQKQRMEAFSQLQKATHDEQGNPISQEEYIANSDTIQPIWEKIRKYKEAMDSLLNLDSQKKAFTRYAKKLFNASQKLILNNADFCNSVLNFGKLSIEQKQKFGQDFINALVKKYKLTPCSFQIVGELELCEADYNFTNKIISAKKDSDFIKSFDLFIGEILHEFTHHIYLYNPEFGPLGEQKSFYATRYGQANGNFMSFEKYKKAPFEAPAYFVQDYFSEHKFTDTLIALIFAQQNTIGK